LLTYASRASFLPRDALWCKARYYDRMSSVRLSVRLSVTLEINFTVGYPGTFPLCNPNMTGLLQGEHP